MARCATHRSCTSRQLAIFHWTCLKKSIKANNPSPGRCALLHCMRRMLLLRPRPSIQMCRRPTLRQRTISRQHRRRTSRVRPRAPLRHRLRASTHNDPRGNARVDGRYLPYGLLRSKQVPQEPERSRSQGIHYRRGRLRASGSLCYCLRYYYGGHCLRDRLRA